MDNLEHARADNVEHRAMVQRLKPVWERGAGFYYWIDDPALQESMSFDVVVDRIVAS